MTIVQRIDGDLIAALKAREAERLGALRMVKTALKLRETEVSGSLGDEDALRVLNTLIKQRRDAAEQFRSAGREDLAAKEEREAKVIQEYLPGAASADDMVAGRRGGRRGDGRLVAEGHGSRHEGGSRPSPGPDRRRQGALRSREVPARPIGGRSRGGWLPASTSRPSPVVPARS